MAAHLIRTRYELLATTLKMPTFEPRTAPMPAAPVDCSRQFERGQAMVEFAAVLLPLILILVAIIQFGFLFSAYVGTSNAAREAGRIGTIYRYDTDVGGQAQNDIERCESILTAAEQSLDPAVPGVFTGACTAGTGGGDLAIAYPDAASCTGTSRTGCQLRVTLTYRQALFVPLVGVFLDTDGNNTIGLTASVTMVMN